jgi:hypothetical protein
MSSLTCGLDFIGTEPPPVVCELKDEGGPGGPNDHQDARGVSVADGVVERQSTDVEAHLLDLPGRLAEVDIAVDLQFDGNAVIVLRSLDEL